MKELIRQQDAVGRMGGDEFAILLLGCSLKESENIAEKLRKLIEDYSFHWEERQFRLSVSIGFVSINNSYQSIDNIFRDADSACYMAKELGRNRVQRFHSNDKTLSKQQGDMHWVNKIHEGIAQNRFLLYGQSFEDLDYAASTQRLEILLRYQDDNGCILPPGAFLPAAERFGISAHIDRYVITATIAFLSETASLLQQIDSIAINLSGLSIADEKFLAFSIDQLSAHPDIAEKICFEITETAAINNLNNAQRFIEELNSLGCQFALDDFGSGLSSFAYLKNFPVDIVKIDGLFVRDIVDDPINLAMVRSINEIAQLMGKKTVAEFVENDQIKSQLQLLGVNYVQGYGIHKPCPINELITSEKSVRSV
jgi:EAL domain-containing protein (putative c-di-GMP-specific phosphodiesterase class I)